MYISALSYAHKLKGVQDNTQTFIVKKALQGLHRKQGTSVDPRVPISISILEQVIDALPAICKAPYEAVLFSTIFSVSYYGLLRVGEVLSIQLTQLSIYKDKVNIIIPKSKTD